MTCGIPLVLIVVSMEYRKIIAALMEFFVRVIIVLIKYSLERGHYSQLASLPRHYNLFIGDAACATQSVPCS